MPYSSPHAHPSSSPPLYTTTPFPLSLYGEQLGHAPHIRPVIPGAGGPTGSRAVSFPGGSSWLKVGGPAPGPGPGPALSAAPASAPTTTRTQLPPLKGWGHTATPLPSLAHGTSPESGPTSPEMTLTPHLGRNYVDQVNWTRPSVNEHPSQHQTQSMYPAYAFNLPTPYYDDYDYRTHHDARFPDRQLQTHQPPHPSLFPSSSTMLPPAEQYTIPPPGRVEDSPPFHPGHNSSNRSSISSTFSTSSTASVSSPPSTNPSPPPSHTLSPETRPAHTVGYADPPAVPVRAVASRPTPPKTSESEEAADDLNLIGGDAAGSGAAGKDGTGKGSSSHFECPGCDLTFTRLSALKQHMLSHTGEKPHACDHCGRRFSLASNLRRHTSTKACKVLKFQTVKENIAGSAAPLSTATMSPPLPTPAPTATTSPIAAAAPIPTPNPVLSPVVPSAPTTSPKKDKKRKAPSDTPAATKPATQRRKRHANQEARWIPRTLALFKNAHLLSSTPPFQFCMYRASKSAQVVLDDSQDDHEDNEPFTRPTLPLHPVRPMAGTGLGGMLVPTTSRASIRSVVSSDSASTHSSSSSDSSGDGNASDDGGEERNSYDVAAEYPYHPASWHGRLPGPGLLGGDELVKNPSVARRWMSFKR